MKLYAIMLFLFIFGFVNAGINEAGIFDVKLPNSNPQITEAQAGQFTQGVGELNPLNPFFIYSMIVSFLKMFGQACLAVVTILPLMYSYGVPIYIGMMIQGPIWLVEAVGIYQLVTGYQMQGMD
jgi:hypothetical protein